ncbi:hypothetical protein [Phocaeicola sp.]
MKTVEQLSIADLNSVAEETSVPIIIWGEEVILSGVYFYKDNRQIAPFFDKIKELLFWFDKSKIEIIQSISDKFIGIVQEWERESNIQKIISSDGLCNSIEIGFCIGDVEDEPLINIYFDCGEHFPDHTVCCYLKKEDDKINYNFTLEG